MTRVAQMMHLYLKMNLPEEAVKKQKQLLEFNPDKPEIKYDLFKVLEQYGFEKEAADFCQETTGPGEVVQFFNNKGVSLAKTEHPKKAISEYERALKYYPKNKKNYLIYYNLALAYLKLGYKDEVLEKAIEALEKV